MRDAASVRGGPPPPTTEDELMARARALAGRTLGDVAAGLGETAPPDLRRHKGWVGSLVERVLGADAGSRDAPDFQALGIELKTIPVDGRGKPVETTFVCTVPLDQVGEIAWSASRVRRKLACVLWVPVQGDRAIAPGDRRVGEPLLWRLDAASEAALRADWEELAGRIGAGAIDSIDGRLGQVMQVRPKAAHGRVRRRAIDAEGALSLTLPRGFYLRTQFTGAILAAHFRLPE